MPVSRTTPFSESFIPAHGYSSEKQKLKRDDMVNCNACWRPKSKVTLKKCGNCLVALYCSEECQREHWELHKTQCKLTEKQRRSCEGDEILTRMNNELFKWTAKHHPTISKTVIGKSAMVIDPAAPPLTAQHLINTDALEVHDRPRTEDDELVLVFLSYEPRSPKIEKRFKVMSAGRASFDSILKLSTNPVLAELPRQRRLMEADHLRKNRNVGVAFCLLVCMMPGAREGRSTSTLTSPSPSLHRIVPITFQKELTPSEKELFRRKRNPNWLSFLVDTTDKGIVF